MRKQKTKSNDPPSGNLRQQAERRLRASAVHPLQSMAESDVRALLHELQVHQIELEMQNEELVQAQASADELRELYQNLFDFAPMGYFVWDAHGAILELNLAAAALLGVERSSAVKMRFSQFLAQEDRPEFAEFCKRVFSAATKQTCEVRLCVAAEPCYVLIKATADPHRQGTAPVCRASVIDITQQRRADELAAANQALRNEIAARKRVEEELAAAKQAAEAANIAKSQFLANISHELRTPMNAVLGMMELSLNETISPVVHDYLTTAEESADGLLALLNELLDFSRIEAGKFQLESAPFPLRSTVDKALRALHMRAQEKGLNLICDVAADVPDQLVGDALRLRQILSNLIGNAIKFTDEGEVVVSVCQADEGRGTEDAERDVLLQFSVTDTGIGIPPEELQAIFDPFVQADPSTTRRYGGTGLGLAIASNLVRLKGGQIAVESVPDAGSTFSFTARFRRGAHVDTSNDDQARPAPAEVGKPLAGIPDRFAAGSSAVITPTPGRPLRILLAEDIAPNQKLAATILRLRGHEVQVANNGREAVELAARQDFDVVLMDVQMPVMDGFEATAAIRALPANGKQRIPIVAMTAHALQADFDRCLAAGMDAYVSKPIKAPALISLVEHIALGDAGTGSQPPAQPAEQAVAVEPTGQPVVFDLAEALRRCFDREMFHGMIDFYFVESGELLARMRAEMASGNTAEVARAAHRLGGTVLYLGAKPTIDAIRRVEKAAALGDVSVAASAIEQLQAEMDRLGQALTAHRRPAATSMYSVPPGEG